jgi:hypothetical protein
VFDFDFDFGSEFEFDFGLKKGSMDLLKVLESMDVHLLRLLLLRRLRYF